MGKSCSRKVKNSAAPEAPVVSATAALVVEGSLESVTSVASYVWSSLARSTGTVGGLGAGGSEYGLTTPTCASLACYRNTGGDTTK